MSTVLPLMASETGMRAPALELPVEGIGFLCLLKLGFVVWVL